MKQYKIEGLRECNKTQLEDLLKKHNKILEDLGMSHEDSCAFVSNCMKIGIAAQEDWDKNHSKKVKK